MNLIKIKSNIVESTEIIYNTVTKTKTLFDGTYLGEEIVSDGTIKSTIKYYKDYYIPIDKIKCLSSLDSVKKQEYLINNISVSKEEFERIIGVLNEK